MLDCIWNPPDLMRKPPSMSCEVWVFNWKFCGNRIEEGVERRSRRNALIDIRGAERARGAAEHREYVVEAMLETDMQRVLRLVAVEREGLGDRRRTARVGIETVAGTQAGVLDPGAVGEVGRRQQADSVLPVAGQRLLRQIVGVDPAERL